MQREHTPNPHQARRRKSDPDDSQAHVHRRMTDSDAVLYLHERVDDHERAIEQIIASQRDMADNLKKLTENTGRLADVLEAWNNVKGFWWTIRMVGAVAKILIPIMMLGGAIWLFIKTGNWELRG